MKNRAKRRTGGQRPPDDPEQSKCFEKMAREVEVDKSCEAFERALDQVIPAQSTPTTQRRKRPTNT